MISRKYKSVPIKDICIFAMLGALMFCSKILMEWAPNIHLLAVFTVTYTLIYRKRALIPIYLYVILNGIFCGFATWWIPYLYIWTVLWAVIILLPKNMKNNTARIVYMVVCCLHGLLFGVLYAPVQALLYGLSFEAMITWIISGFPFDIIQGIGNFFLALLIVPISTLLNNIDKKI